jgi:hypothetical protein
VSANDTGLSGPYLQFVRALRCSNVYQHRLIAAPMHHAPSLSSHTVDTTSFACIYREFEMDTPSNRLLSSKELARRWDRSETAISLAAAVGVGPRYIKTGGQVMYAMDEIQKYERACLYFDPAEVALQTMC